MGSYVINSNGKEEPFSYQKVYRSARRVNASKELARVIAKTVTREAYDGIKTSEIFKKVKELLYRQTPETALRFSLKEGMRKLGPTGFPFEKFIGEIFKSLDFKIKINQHLPGFCLDSYEIDFLAEKDDLIYIGECKYRNVAGEMVHLKDALSNYARFSDILKGPAFAAKKYQNFKIKTIMVTNAKFTGQAINYSSCIGVNLLGWKYPQNHGLEYLIEKNNLYPVTVLPSLRGYLKDIFVSERIMLARDILKINPQKFLKKFRISSKHLYNVIEEAKILLSVERDIITQYNK